MITALSIFLISFFVLACILFIITARVLYKHDELLTQNKTWLQALSDRNRKLEADLDILKFEQKHGENKTIITPYTESTPYWFITKYYLEYVCNRKIIKLYTGCAHRDKIEIKKDTETETIVKMYDKWYKLDKSGEKLIDIPEPAEFAEKNKTKKEKAE